MIKTFVNYDTTSNTYLIKENEKYYIIDPGSTDMNELISYLKENNIKLEAIILTHGHFDHMIGIPRILDYQIVPIYVHELDKELLFNPRYSLMSWGNLDQEVLQEYLSKTNIILIKENDIIANYRVLHTPGHTKGSICLLNEEKKLMFSGDTLFKGTYGRVDFPTGNPRDMRDSLSKLLRLDKDIIVYPGHSDSTSIRQEYETYMSYSSY